MKDYSCELGAACGPEAAAGRELAAVRKRRCVAEEAQVAGEGDELLLLLFVRAVVRDDAHWVPHLRVERVLLLRPDLLKIVAERVGAKRFTRRRLAPPRRHELTAPAAAPRERARNWKPDTA